MQEPVAIIHRESGSGQFQKLIVWLLLWGGERESCRSGMVQRNKEGNLIWNDKEIEVIKIHVGTRLSHQRMYGTPAT
jgi:hypothetical protein